MPFIISFNALKAISATVQLPPKLATVAFVVVVSSSNSINIGIAASFSLTMSQNADSPQPVNQYYLHRYKAYLIYI